MSYQFSDETKELLNLVVEKLPQEEKEVVLCLFYDRLSYRQTARRVGLSPRQVGRVLERACRRLEPLMLAAEGVEL